MKSYRGLFGAHRTAGFAFIDQTPKNPIGMAGSSACPDKTAAAVMLNHRAQDWRDNITCLNAPLLVMTGRQSSIFPYESSVRIATNAPDAELVAFEDSGPCSFWGEAYKLNETLAAFTDWGPDN